MLAANSTPLPSYRMRKSGVVKSVKAGKRLDAAQGSDQRNRSIPREKECSQGGICKETRMNCIQVIFQQSTETQTFRQKVMFK
jgi:hypothetical protein